MHGAQARQHGPCCNPDHLDQALQGRRSAGFAPPDQEQDAAAEQTCAIHALAITSSWPGWRVQFLGGQSHMLRTVQAAAGVSSFCLQAGNRGESWPTGILPARLRAENEKPQWGSLAATFVDKAFRYGLRQKGSSRPFSKLLRFPTRILQVLHARNTGRE